MSFEKNTINSFRKVREDIENLQHQISQLKQKVEDIDVALLKKEEKTATKSKNKKR
ncbi:MAG: hypothetical protein Q8N63_02890 [Nanoarchaeota archaeon]|nr:hypothetical protein [Nanoarchaeota archaeon]